MFSLGQNKLLKVLYILLPISCQSCVVNIIFFPAGVESAGSETFVDQLTAHGKHRVSLMPDKGLRASLFYNNAQWCILFSSFLQEEKCG